MLKHTALLLASLLTGNAAQAATGAQIFQKNCAMCHSATASHGAGPGLAGVFARKLGSAPDYNYSEAMQRAGASGRRWSVSAMDAFLTDPAKFMPGTTMPFALSDKAERDSVIAYLIPLQGQSAAAPAPAAAPVTPAAPATPPLWLEDAPGNLRYLKASEMVAPYATPSAGNPPKIVARPEGAMPNIPKGFKINLYATDPDKGRLMIRAPNGDVFVSVPHKNMIKVFRSSTGVQADSTSVFISGLDRPFGIAFYPSTGEPRFLYVATVNQVLRIPYANGQLVSSSAPQVVVPSLTAAKGAHSSRTLAFSADDKMMFVSIGSATNVANTMEPAPPLPLPEWESKYGVGASWGDELDRAVVLAFDPEGGARHTFATGLRNCVGMVLYPPTRELLCSVNERDELGDRLPPDYVTRVAAGSFYGWPWYYIGANEDPRLAGKRPDLRSKVSTPDVLLQAHSAPLGMAPYLPPPGARYHFGKEYEGDVFLALHGSWNAATRTGSKVVRLPMRNGVPTGGYQDFMTGLIVSDKEVWGRPSSVLVASDGALLVDDDASGTIWRIIPE